ncbi:Tetratricopeptide repeat family protein [Theileria parva strain Muguga]|uniref:peptidylprolyl isomerase n=1 Tax=Theileria parva TaxID=5875 RepID=Q4N993_THEPA|nr:Tetratricopeptide repeat family protein [Theileria parva strain Muguga]EAN33465.1 Tetratricopeptide repeat family protein [Theileria parva strain Muguga]|eukprot:XP_765748.1 hypothetical protein [Theileria parva strain Muguga]
MSEDNSENSVGSPEGSKEMNSTENHKSAEWESQPDSQPRSNESQPSNSDPDKSDSSDTPSVYDNKEKGNELFSKGDIDGAIEKWSKSINSLSYILNKSKAENNSVTEDSLTEYTKMYVTLCSNLSLAFLKKEDFTKCKEYCQYVLMYDEKNLKAHLRIVQADIKLKNLDNALSNCEKGLKLNPEDNELKGLKTVINDLLKKQKKVDAVFARKVFKKIEPDPRTAPDPFEELKKTKFYRINYAIYMMYLRLFLIIKFGWDYFKRGVLFSFDYYSKVSSRLRRFFSKSKQD